MLSQYDRQQLELISSRLQIDDPELAKALRDGKPRPLPVNHRWPIVVLGFLALLVFVAGVLVGAPAFLFLGAIALTAIIWWYRTQSRKEPRVRVSRRRRKP
jgi:Flp pilus assembly protein TadB